LLEGLYEGIASPGKWQGALQQVNTALGGVSAALVSLHRPSDQLTIEYAGAMIPDLAAGFAAMQDVDPGRAAVPLLAAGKIYIDHDFHGHAGLLRMPFYRDFLHPAGIGHYALIPVGTEADELPALSVQREVGRRSFTSRERQLMQAVQPHLRNALALRKQLQHQRAESLVLKSTLDALNFPLLVCSPRGRVVIGNAAAAGPVGRPLLSGFYAMFSAIVPQGSGVALLRSVSYFDGNGAQTPLVTLAVWAAAGILCATLAVAARLNYRALHDRVKRGRDVLRPRVLSPAD